MDQTPSYFQPSGTAVILAAGLGTRMKSARPKVLHPIAGRSMLQHLIAACQQVFSHIVVVIGPDMDSVAREAAPHPTVVQQERLGTAHAALQAMALVQQGEVAILYGDNPLISTTTLHTLVQRRRQGDAVLAMLAMHPPEPGRYGRVITEKYQSGDYVSRIVEYAEANEQERAVTLCNAGVFCADAVSMAAWLGGVDNANSKGEYYLGDIIPLAIAGGGHVAAVEAPYEELRGINSKMELAEAEATVQIALRRQALEKGVTMTAPDTVFLSADTMLAPDVLVGPHVVFGPGVTVEEGAEIRAFSHLEGCHVGRHTLVGPYARLRPGSVLGAGAHVGNFVELKQATLGEGAKANHLTYLGDVEVGARANIGAGTITCNYDGVHKHRTEIGDDAFIGSDTALVAPVRIGRGAITGAGSVIVEDVPADALALARGRQVNKPERAAEIRRQLKGSV
ncbi:UDP-N-acetylglucosamine pyrophosphorylase [Granulibacter bethesdensis]|uniref:bifunctional UDP-N-acetylglucosamine diphosphorylase/glucosamine-1-phosphate N-acetyltransferase GlmU n=1 Tax=Granulibacter bethesdensis TaxID=364410 RepID=UPI00090A7A86|nr:bifunctional UDP-N-acetylglucosamine diphosphorylase/glucosamine-1-phosphate N-acetyltransferase GlmU [Granulibacter bethesdensis]APH57048.1 UDP-N-acetylglucosamine pyrophosphorylase [Granulibacter bethesdensis]